MQTQAYAYLRARSCALIVPLTSRYPNRRFYCGYFVLIHFLEVELGLAMVEDNFGLVHFTK